VRIYKQRNHHRERSRYNFENRNDKTESRANMRAARYYGKEDIRIETDVAEAKCGTGEVRVCFYFP